MSERERKLVDLASRVSDGAAVDWDEEERDAATEEERRVVRHLRLVESVASVHRSQATISAGATVDAPGSALDGEHSASPRSWGRLEIRQKIGEGAFGEVYRAWDVNLDREVALKLLKKEPSGRSSLASSVLKEGRLLARVRHPNVVTVYGAETHDGRVGLWMELVRGKSLANLLQEQGRLGAREAALIGLELCHALAAVHGAGLVHRDIKARNVMRAEGGRILLMDFGAGRDLREIEGRQDRSISGTPLYIAPEVFARQPATSRSDIYSLGVLLYHLVTGSYPIKARSLDDLREKHAQRRVTLLRDARSDLPDAFVNVIERALARDPRERFATAGEMERALAAAVGAAGERQASTPRSVSRRTVGAVAAIVALVAVTAAVVWLLPTGVGDRSGEAVDTRSLPVPAAPSRPTPPPAGSYTVEAALYRVGATGTRERLESGSQLALGDKLSLEIEASRDLFVYVINEDEEGRAYALFPMPSLELTNPLPADRKHVLPGNLEGESVTWQVDTPGGREHLLVLASPERLTEFESEMSRLPRPQPGQVAMAIPESAKIRLRGIGGLAAAPATTPEGTAGRLFEMADEMVGKFEVVEGPWVRRIELENPKP